MFDARTAGLERRTLVEEEGESIMKN